MDVQNILQRIIELSSAAGLPKPWHFLSPEPNIRVLRDAPSTLVATLVSEFLEEELVESQVLQRTSAGKLQLSPVISEGGPFKVLQETKDGLPCDLEHAQGRLTSGDPPALRCFDDHMTRERSARRKFVLATLSSLDLSVLTLLGLPATSATGLNTLTADQACRLFGRPTSDKPQLPDGQIPLTAERETIVVVCTELYALKNQMPCGSLHIVEQMRRLERAKKIDTASRIGFWLPSTQEFQRIGDAAFLADKKLLVRAICDSVKNCESAREYVESTLAPDVNHISKASTALHDALDDLNRSTFGVRDLPGKLQGLSRLVKDMMIARAIHAAMVARNPIIKSYWHAAAEIMELQFEASGLVQRTRAAIAAGRAAADDRPIEERLRIQLRIVEVLTKIKRAIEESN